MSGPDLGDVVPPVAVVTGAARGIGDGIARALRHAGYRVAEIDIAPLRTVRPEESEDALTIGADLSDANAASQVVASVLARWSRLDVLVNNAAVGGPRLLASELGAGDDAVARTFDVNLFAPMRLVHAAMPALRASGRGRIINISSVFRERPAFFDSTYSMTKAALVAFTRSLALEEGQYGVTANAVEPGLVLTQMHLDEVDSQAREAGVTRDERLRQLRRGVATGRHGMPADIADLVVWLASPGSAYLTGQTLAVDGGLTIGWNE